MCDYDEKNKEPAASEAVTAGEVTTKSALFEAVLVKLKNFFAGLVQKKGERLVVSDTVELGDEDEKKIEILQFAFWCLGLRWL